ITTSQGLFSELRKFRSAHFQKRHALVHRILRKSRKTLSDARQVLCASIQSHCVGSKYRVVGSVLVQ
ncbi:hypothetical protein, partial [Escherichia coli]|uniref:hypothetical protein n=1 Tax=Escherichia coli TaxID=562 RepID=UPI001BDBD69B